MEKSSININTNFPNKGMNQDVSDFNQNKESWMYARNTVINSNNGDILHLQNEPSNSFCANFPYTFIGSVKIKNNRHVIFTTDNINSEIGIFNELNCTYAKYVNDPCLNFSTANPIFAAVKDDIDGFESIYFADGQRNEIRKLSLNPEKIPYKYTLTYTNGCPIKTPTTELDCNLLSFTPNFIVPTIEVNKNNFSGSLKNGSYQFAIAYSINNQRLTDFYNITFPIHIWSHQNNLGSIDIDITNIDPLFSEFQLVCIATVENQTFYKLLGSYNVSQTKLNISNLNKIEYEDIPLAEITIKKTYYQKADQLVANDQYLFLKGVSTRKKINYQQQAMQIQSYYDVWQAREDYYKTGNKVGYYRDEVYSFQIQWLFSDGEWSDCFHIAGRKSNNIDLEIINNNDVPQETNCNTYQNKRWQVYNTASVLNTPFINLEECEIKYVGTGSMSYHESTINYPDNDIMFGNEKCTPIRHHKFPSEKQVPRYVSNNDGIRHINILGVHFENIQHPLDENNNPVQDIVGYRIFRSDRNGNRSIIARGVSTNVRGLTDVTNPSSIKSQLYSNYPFNHGTGDLFLNQYNPNVDQKAISQPNIIYQDKFTFYSPHSHIGRVGLGNILTIDGIESCKAETLFYQTENHPKHKLLTNSALIFCLIIGAIDGWLRTQIGSQIEVKYKDGLIVSTITPPGSTHTMSLTNVTSYQKANDILQSINNINVNDLDPLNPTDAIKIATINTLKTLLTTVLTTFTIGIQAIETAQKVYDLIYNSVSFEQYAIQQNTIGRFTKTSYINEGNYRREIKSYQYLSEGINTINELNIEYNNLYKKDNVYISLNSNLNVPTDTSQVLLNNRNINQIYRFADDVKLVYTTVKRTIENQYGQLDSSRHLSTGEHIISTFSNIYTSSTIFGGDCYINRYTVNNPTDFFTHPLYKQANGFELDYTTIPAIAYPRYWANFIKYDLSEQLSNLSLTNIISSVNNFTPSSKHELNGPGNTLSISKIKNKYFYTSVNAVFDFIVESDYNLENRDWQINKNFYSQNPNHKSIFENKGENRTYEEFVFDKSYLKQLNEDIFYQQPLDYNITNYLSYFPNKVIYSLPAFKEQKFDNWLVYLSNNRFDFSQSQFGNLTSVKLIDNQQLIFLFDKASPYFTPGRAELKTIDEQTIYLGDGTLIREPKPLLLTDDNFASCSSRFAFNYTKFGIFYPSQTKGNVFQLNGTSPTEISRNGMYYFFNNYLPSNLLKEFPNYIHKDNPYIGTSLISTYDPTYEMYYITKKDYILNPKYKNLLTYNPVTDTFNYNNLVVTLNNKEFFKECSFTISYSPALKAFISFHDYKPNAYITGENNFMSIINIDNKSQIWKHNERNDNFCKFYNVNYPHSFIVPINNNQNVQVLNSLEYISDAYKYIDNFNKEYVPKETYNKAFVLNNEQFTGMLNLKIKNKNKLSEMINYNKAKLNQNNELDIYIDKVEEKFRINTLRDVSKYRDTNINFLLYNPDGYTFIINKDNIDYEISNIEKRKIRNNTSKLYLERTISENNKLIFYLNNYKQSISSI